MSTLMVAFLSAVLQESERAGNDGPPLPCRVDFSLTFADGSAINASWSSGEALRLDLYEELSRTRYARPGLGQT
jgi:hypothetical protein